MLSLSDVDFPDGRGFEALLKLTPGLAGAGSTKESAILQDRRTQRANTD